MPKTFSLTAKQRDELLHMDRKDPDPELRFRTRPHPPPAGRGYAWDTIEAMLFCSSRTVDRWLKRFRPEGFEGLPGGSVAAPVGFASDGSPPRLLGDPEDPPPLRLPPQPLVPCGAGPAAPCPARRRRPAGRPSAAGSIVAPWSTGGPGRSTSRTRKRGRPSWPKLRKLLEGLPDDETAVLQDEVEMHINPKIGPMWTLQGQQAEVETPGTNEKRYLSRSIHWRTGREFLTEAAPKEGREWGPVPQAPGRPAAEASVLPDDPRHLRQRRAVTRA